MTCCADVLLPAVPAYLTWDPPPGRLNSMTDLYLWQDGRCAMCGASTEAFGPFPLRLLRDHDHATGLPRGWLCRGCNHAEGRGGRGPAQDPVWQEYRRRPPAVLYGIRRLSEGGPVKGFVYPSVAAANAAAWVKRNRDEAPNVTGEDGR
jgi:hypothetical protein